MATIQALLVTMATIQGTLKYALSRAFVDFRRTLDLYKNIMLNISMSTFLVHIILLNLQ